MTARLPDATNITFCFSAALAAPIKDSEGESDGAEYKAFAYRIVTSAPGNGAGLSID